ncbi:uncharacterized protein LOC134503012 isoform X2 [Candoia aspera]|uniref:uncharacterized protein LOC134503012 isoform X2 n=1 Tax=Candoia aspera TaxID=51853 RepID=UPI002FD879CF
MGGWEQLLCATVLGLFFQGISISGNAASENEFIIIKQKGKTVSLICEGGNNKTSWRKDRTALRHKGKELALGAMMDDPRGFYECSISDKENRSLQVFFRSDVPELHPPGLHHGSGDFSSQPLCHSLPGCCCVPHSCGRAGLAIPSFR